MRPSAAQRTGQQAPDLRRFADEVAYYLSQNPRQLPSRYLYDELGSALFEAICRLPWYSITRIEEQLLRASAGAVLGRAGAPGTLVELGPGSGAKLAALLESTPSGLGALRVHLVDVSRVALEASVTALQSESVTVVTHQAEYEDGLADVVRSSTGRRLILFLGSNLGNFDPPGADAFLDAIRQAAGPGGQLLLGTDLVRPRDELLLAYDDPLGVTSAFNRNLLVRINRELGGNFDVRAFAHRAVWNETASRMEMHLVSDRRQRVHVEVPGLDITFEAGETIWTESSYKYRPGGVVAMLERSGFRTLGQWARDRYALTLAEAAR